MDQFGNFNVTSAPVSNTDASGYLPSTCPPLSYSETSSYSISSAVMWSGGSVYSAPGQTTAGLRVVNQPPLFSTPMSSGSGFSFRTEPPTLLDRVTAEREQTRTHAELIELDRARLESEKQALEQQIASINTIRMSERDFYEEATIFQQLQTAETVRTSLLKAVAEKEEQLSALEKQKQDALQAKDREIEGLEVQWMLNPYKNNLEGLAAPLSPGEGPSGTRCLDELEEGFPGFSESFDDDGDDTYYPSGSESEHELDLGGLRRAQARVSPIATPQAEQSPLSQSLDTPVTAAPSRAVVIAPIRKHILNRDKVFTIGSAKEHCYERSLLTYIEEQLGNAKSWDGCDFASMVNSLQQHGCCIPKYWKELKSGLSWSPELIRYAAFRLDQKYADLLTAKCFNLLEPASEAYFLTLSEFFCKLVTSKSKQHVTALEQAGVAYPPHRLFKQKHHKWKEGHADFFQWYCKPAEFEKNHENKKDSFRYMLNILNPDTPEYAEVMTKYLLLALGKQPNKNYVLHIDAGDTKKITTLISRFKVQLVDIPGCVRTDPDDNDWTPEKLKQVFVHRGLKVDEQGRPLHRNSFLAMREAKKKADLETYKVHLKHLAENSKYLPRAIANQLKFSNPDRNWRLWGIKGTLIGSQKLSTEGFWLSYLYYHGTKGISSNDIRFKLKGIMKMIDNPTVDDRLKRVYDQLLILKFSTTKNEEMPHACSWLKNIPVFKKSISPDYNYDDLRKLRDQLSGQKVIWKDDEVITAEYKPSAIALQRLARNTTGAAVGKNAATSKRKGKHPSTSSTDPSVKVSAAKKKCK